MSLLFFLADNRETFPMKLHCGVMAVEFAVETDFVVAVVASIFL